MTGAESVQRLTASLVQTDTNGESLAQKTLCTSLTYIWTQAINGSRIMRQ